MALAAAFVAGAASSLLIAGFWIWATALRALGASWPEVFSTAASLVKPRWRRPRA